MSQVIRTGGSQAAADGQSTPQTSDRPHYVVGEVIADKYKLVSQLAEGGMGALWVAKNIALDAHVALKLIRTDVATESVEERFSTEARAAARLKHPSIVRVFDFGRTRQNEPFIVMELLSGESLGEVLDREGKVPATYAVQVLLPIADALAAAHSREVIHRDLKPDNIILADSDGRLVPKILDFGIAKLQGNPVTSHRITAAGTVVGSPDYLSPEQARGLEDIDHRADIWAFCVLLYECITGHVPFEDASYNALLRHIIEDDVPPITEHGVGDADLWTIMAKGFEKRPEDRHQSMRELGEALAGWLVARGVTEDVTGHSLRAGWLEPQEPSARTSLPGYRLSIPSSPVAASQAPSEAGNEGAHTPSSAAGARRPTLAMVLAILLAGVAGFALVRYLTSSTPPAASARSATDTLAPSTAMPSANFEAQPTADTRSGSDRAIPAAEASAAPQLVTTPAPPAAAAPLQKSGAPGAAPPGLRRPSTPAPTVTGSSPRAPGTGKPKGAYGEDLGF